MSSLAGSFLVARPVLSDSSFRQSVVLLLEHNDQGAFGLVINRPAPAEGLPFPVYVGGPCKSQGLLMLHGHPEWLPPSAESGDDPVAPGIYLGDAACLSRATEAAPGQVLRVRVVIGYSGWGPGQLEGELAAGAWALAPATAQILFDTPVEELWDRLVPSKIPQPSIN